MKKNLMGLLIIAGLVCNLIADEPQPNLPKFKDLVGPEFIRFFPYIIGTVEQIPKNNIANAKNKDIKENAITVKSFFGLETYYRKVLLTNQTRIRKTILTEKTEIKEGDLVRVDGVLREDNEKKIIDARNVVILSDLPEKKISKIVIQELEKRKIRERRIVGTVQNISSEGDQFEVISEDGIIYIVALTGETNIYKIVPSEIGELKEREPVIICGYPDKNTGSLNAVDIIVSNLFIVDLLRPIYQKTK
jgi:hypothetical protein